jgi:hypothetical protein
MDLRIEFWNEEQEAFVFSKARNSRFGGGFGNGKTYAACIKALIMLMSFPGYRVAICRQVYKNLRSTTMQTFLKVCPKEFIKTHDVQFGLTVFINGSCIYWLHLDTMDEATAKGFEINALIIDQAEEVDEAIFLLMDSRVGRWDKAEVPQHLLDAYPQWPRHPKGNYPQVPNYSDVLDNPSDDEFHWVSRYFDEDSLERKEGYFSIVRKTDDNMNDPRTITEIKKRDPEWLEKYYYGKKVVSKALLHQIPKICSIDPDSDFLSDADFDSFINLVRKKGNLYRILDHGETDPTCVLWAASIFNVHLLFGEYYMPNEVISNHRQNIYDFSEALLGGTDLINDCNDLADPSCFDSWGQRKGKTWTVADEYLDEEDIKTPPIAWSKADNNELATRNRINELFRLQARWKSPLDIFRFQSQKVELTNEARPGIYFLLRSKRWPFGVHNILVQTSQQRKKLLGEISGKKIYSEERDPKIPDHGYDTLRYYVAAHNSGKAEITRKPPARSFARLNKIWKMRRMMMAMDE